VGGVGGGGGGGGADKSLARPGRKQVPKHVRDARDFNKTKTRAVIKFLFLQGKAPKEIRAILTETLACFLPGRAKDLSASKFCTTVFKTRGLPTSQTCKGTQEQHITIKLSLPPCCRPLPRTQDGRGVILQ